MKLHCEQHDQLAVYALKGDLTAESVDALRKSATQHMAAATRDFVLDVAEVEFIDSAGLEALIWLQDTAAGKLGQVRLACTGPNVEKILEMTRLAGRFDRHADVDSAIKSLR